MAQVEIQQLCAVAPARTYDEVENALDALLRSWAQYGTNPLADLGPTSRVVLKPNWVTDINPTGAGVTCLVTHSALIAAVADRVAQAMGGGGHLTIGDAPVQSCDFDRLRRLSRVDEFLNPVRKRWPRLELVVEDWRLTVRTLSRGVHDAHRGSPDPRPDAHVAVDLGARSFLECVSGRSRDFRVTCYPPSMMAPHHCPGHHEYLVARGALNADLFINLPKLKTHKKAGITGALKNLVGINGHKEFLPHHVKGTPADGGDAFPSASTQQRLFERYYDFHFEHLASLRWPYVAAASRFLTLAERSTTRRSGGVSFGSWPGNDTIWRMTMDLNHLLYAWATPRPGRVFTIVDAVTVGEGDGPLRPSARWLGYLLAGTNPAAVDFLGAALLGYAPLSLRTIQRAAQDQNSMFQFDTSNLAVIGPDWHEPQPYSPDLLRHVSARRPPGWEAV